MWRLLLDIIEVSLKIFTFLAFGISYYFGLGEKCINDQLKSYALHIILKNMKDKNSAPQGISLRYIISNFYVNTKNAGLHWT